MASSEFLVSFALTLSGALQAAERDDRYEVNEETSRRSFSKVLEMVEGAVDLEIEEDTVYDVISGPIILSLKEGDDPGLLKPRVIEALLDDRALPGFSGEWLAGARLLRILCVRYLGPVLRHRLGVEVCALAASGRALSLAGGLIMLSAAEELSSIAVSEKRRAVIAADTLDSAVRAFWTRVEEDFEEASDFDIEEGEDGEEEEDDSDGGTDSCGDEASVSNSKMEHHPDISLATVSSSLAEACLGLVEGDKKVSELAVQLLTTSVAAYVRAGIGKGQPGVSELGPASNVLLKAAPLDEILLFPQMPKPSDEEGNELEDENVIWDDLGLSLHASKVITAGGLPYSHDQLWRIGWHHVSVLLKAGEAEAEDESKIAKLVTETALDLSLSVLAPTSSIPATSMVSNRLQLITNALSNYPELAPKVKSIIVLATTKSRERLRFFSDFVTACPSPAVKSILLNIGRKIEFEEGGGEVWNRLYKPHWDHMLEPSTDVDKLVEYREVYTEAAAYATLKGVRVDTKSAAEEKIKAAGDLWQLGVLADTVSRLKTRAESG